MTEMTPKEILLAAADLIERTNLAKGAFAWKPDRRGKLIYAEPNDPNANCYCTLGGLRSVCGLDSSAEAPKALHEAIELLKSTLNVGIIVFWNDDPARTKEEVVSALRRAAA